MKIGARTDPLYVTVSKATGVLTELSKDLHQHLLGELLARSIYNRKIVLYAQ